MRLPQVTPELIPCKSLVGTADTNYDVDKEEPTMGKSRAYALALDTTGIAYHVSNHVYSYGRDQERILLLPCQR
jgi:hypothetical protein